MQVFDASSMIHAWDNYPVEQFPGLWEWIAEEITSGRLVIPSVAFEEVSHKVPECCVWLRGNNIERVDVTNAILQEAMNAKTLIGVVNDSYHPKGVDENDLLIIATAKIKHADLVSEEARQPVISVNEPTKRKIPAVCALHQVSVNCINFIDYIKRSQAVFR